MAADAKTYEWIPSSDPDIMTIIGTDIIALYTIVDVQPMAVPKDSFERYRVFLFKP